MKKILSIFFVFTLMFVNVKVCAKDFSKSENVSIKKQWTIEFTKDVNESSVNENTIWVEDGNKNKVPIGYKISGKYVKISPKTQYDYEKTYKIMIDKNVLSAEKKPLKNGIVKEFTTEKNINNNSEYDIVTTWEGYNKPYGYKFIANTDIDYPNDTGIFIYIGDEDDCSKIPQNAIYERGKCIGIVNEYSSVKTMLKKGDHITTMYSEFRDYEGKNIYYKIIKGVKTNYGELIIDENTESTEWKYCGKMPHQDNVDRQSKVSANILDLQNPENKNCIIVTNDNSQNIDLTGWYIEVTDPWGFSKEDTYYFKEGTVLNSNESFKILLSSYENSDMKYDLLWKTDTQLNYGQRLILYNAKSEIVQGYCEELD